MVHCKSRPAGRLFPVVTSGDTLRCALTWRFLARYKAPAVSLARIVVKSAPFLAFLSRQFQERTLGGISEQIRTHRPDCRAGRDIQGRGRPGARCDSGSSETNAEKKRYGHLGRIRHVLCRQACCTYRAEPAHGCEHQDQGCKSPKVSSWQRFEGCGKLAGLDRASA